MSGKFIILITFSFIAGLCFSVIGFYFLSNHFIDKIKEASPDKSEKGIKNCIFRCKGSGYVSISFGALTIMWGILLILFPTLVPALALTYMIFLIIAFLILVFVFK